MDMKRGATGVVCAAVLALAACQVEEQQRLVTTQDVETFESHVEGGLQVVDLGKRVKVKVRPECCHDGHQPIRMQLNEFSWDVSCADGGDIVRADTCVARTEEEEERARLVMCHTAVRMMQSWAGENMDMALEWRKTYEVNRCTEVIL